MSESRDTILIEVISSALASVVEEMSETLVKAAFSPNIKERRDCTASLFDAEGQAIAQDEGGSPLHLGSLMGIVAAIRERHAEHAICDGDVFIGNDPYTGGGSHLPDIVLASPIFVDGELTAWAATLAHPPPAGPRCVQNRRVHRAPPPPQSGATIVRFAHHQLSAQIAIPLDQPEACGHRLAIGQACRAHRQN